MKTKRNKKSFIHSCIFYFGIYAVILLATYIFLNYLVNNKFNHEFPNFDDFIKYEHHLQKDEFSRVPIRKFKGCDYLVFNDENQTIFSTNKDLEDYISGEDLEFISDYNSDATYSLFIRKNNEEIKYVVMKNGFDNNYDFFTIEDYAILDEEYNIKEGNLFKGRQKLNDREFKLIQGIFINQKEISKHRYHTDNNELRTLIFISPKINTNFYNAAINKANRLWLFVIPVVIFVIIIETILIVRKLKNSLKPLNTAIESYEKNAEFKIDPKEIPQEFNDLVMNFKDLLNKLSIEKARSEKMFQDKQRIIADISHDLKTPLTVIKGYSAAFIDGIVPREKQGQYMKAIYNKAESTANLLDSLFEYTQLEHPDYKMNIEPVDICEFSKEYLAKKYFEIDIQKFKLIFEIPEEKVILNIDKKLIIRLFDNIIGNSLKYNKKGTKIYFKLIIKDKRVIFTTGDSGIGIDKEIAMKAFEPFFTGDISRTGKTGTGIGLSIVKKVVELHNGKIKIVYPPKNPYKTQIEIILFR